MLVLQPWQWCLAPKGRGLKYSTCPRRTLKFRPSALQPHGCLCPGHTEHQKVLNFLFSWTPVAHCTAPAACNNLPGIPLLILQSEAQIAVPWGNLLRPLPTPSVWVRSCILWASFSLWPLSVTLLKTQYCGGCLPTWLSPSLVWKYLEDKELCFMNIQFYIFGT